MLEVPGLVPPLVVLPLNEFPVVALPAGFAPPVVAAPLPFADGVAAGVAPGVAGKDVIGVGRSGIGFDMTPATNSVTFASVAFLFRNL